MLVFTVHFGELESPNIIAELLCNLPGKVNKDRWAGFGPGTLFVTEVVGTKTKCPVSPQYRARIHCSIDVSGTADVLLGSVVFHREYFGWIPEPDKDDIRCVPDDLDVSVVFL